MAEMTTDAVRKAFADLTAQLEDAVLIAVQGQGIQSFYETRRSRKRLAAAIDHIGQRLKRLERRLK